MVLPPLFFSSGLKLMESKFSQKPSDGLFLTSLDGRVNRVFYRITK